MQGIILKRNYFEDATIGHWYPEGGNNPVFFTIEKPNKDNKPNISCIPEGSYNVVPYSSKNHPCTWKIQNVPDRSKILIDVANWEHELKGCIALGLSAGYMRHNNELKKAVTSSRHAMRMFKDLIGYPSSFQLYIKS